MTDEYPETLTKDAVFEILSSSRRRFALYALARENGRLDLETLARELAAHEEEIPIETVSDDQQKRMYISLYQTHMPKLSEAGLVDYDREQRVVTLTDDVEELVAFLHTERSPPRAWTRWYGILAGIALLLTVATLVLPALVTPLQWLLVVDLLAAFGLALGHWRSETPGAVQVERQLEAIV